MTGRVRAFAELLRLSNVLTAVADVWMGMIVATGGLPEVMVAAPLTVASVLLYLSGMVLNDVFDAPRDALERPTRPIPSGRISRREAAWLGGALMAGGVAAAGVAAVRTGGAACLAAAGGLAGLVLLYNSRLKATPAGPLLMGLCRAANATLGLVVFCPLAINSKLDAQPPAAAWWITGGLAVYVLGLTLFARGEASVSPRPRLIFGASVSMLGVLVFALAPVWLGTAGDLKVPLGRWWLLLAVVGMLIARRYAAAILQPTPGHVQRAVGNAIQGVILIDAALAWGYAEPFWGLAIFALLPPTVLLARFIPQT